MKYAIAISSPGVFPYLTISPPATIPSINSKGLLVQIDERCDHVNNHTALDRSHNLFPSPLLNLTVLKRPVGETGTYRSHGITTETYQTTERGKQAYTATKNQTSSISAR